MSPRKNNCVVVMAPFGPSRIEGAPPRGRLPCLLVVFLTTLLAFPSPGDAERRKRRRKKAKPVDSVASVKETKSKSGGKNQVFDFTGLNLGASMRTPQLLYFLDRASEELHRASLQRRSFVPAMVRSISEEGL